MANKLVKEIKKLIKEKKKELKNCENKSDIFTIVCEICGAKRMRLDGKDFEEWDKNLFFLDHKHKIRRFLKGVIKHE